jgi:hypothetical protein
MGGVQMSIRGRELQAERDFAEGKPERLRPLRERDIEDYLVKRVASMGGEVRKVQWVGRRGAPDRRVMLPPVPFRGKPLIKKLFWIELKAPGVKPEDYQLREHARMRAFGDAVFVIDSLAGVDEVLS